MDQTDLHGHPEDEEADRALPARVTELSRGNLTADMLRSILCKKE